MDPHGPPWPPWIRKVVEWFYSDATLMVASSRIPEGNKPAVAGNLLIERLLSSRNLGQDQEELKIAFRLVWSVAYQAGATSTPQVRVEAKQGGQGNEPE